MTDDSKQQPQIPEEDEWKKKAEEYLNGWKRAKADLVNFQRETERRNQEFVTFAHAGVLLAFLPLHESITKAVAEISEEDRVTPFGQGLENIKKQCDDFLKRFGLSAIPAKGQSLNLELHEAVGKEKRDGAESGIILEEVQTGYTMHGKVLRPSKVIVAE